MKKMFQILIAIWLFILAIYLQNLYLYVVTYLIIGYEVLWESFKNICKGEIFDEQFLMTIATFGAIYLQEWNEAIAIMLFYQIGETLQWYALNNARKKIDAVLSIVSDYANLESGEKIDAKDVKIGSMIIVKVGERVPIDGIIIDGYSTIDNSALTGESMPQDINVGDTILSGSINLSAVLKIKTLKIFADSTASKILELVEYAEEHKAKTERFIRKFAKYYTPFVVISTILVAIFTSIQTAIILLLISCPCSLIISIPLSFFAGLGLSSKNGILIKGSNYIEELAKAQYIIFDKTGTITKGKFEVVNVDTTINKDEFLKLVAHAEMYSNHPIAKSIVDNYGKELDKNIVKNVEEIRGVGIKAMVEGRMVEIRK